MRLSDILSYLFKFKLSFVRELVLFEKWYQKASHTQCLQGSVENLGLRPRFSTLLSFFKPPESHSMSAGKCCSYLFKFKLSFVRELVLFEKWYQEASHTQCLQGSVENLGLRPRFSTPRALPSVFINSLNLLTVNAN